MNPITNNEPLPPKQSSNFDNLSENQQMTALNFLQLTNTEDIDLALRYLKKANFIMDRALEMYFSGQMPEEETKQGPMNTSSSNTQQTPYHDNNQGFIDPFYGQNFGNSIVTGNQFVPQNNGLQRSNTAPQANDLGAKYRLYANRKNQEEEDNATLGGMITSAGKSAVSMGKNMLGYFTTDYLGTQFIKYITKRYNDMKKNVDFLDKYNFEDALLKAKQLKRPLCVYCHQDGALFAAIPEIVFKSKPVTDTMRNSFHNLGILVNTEKANFITKYVQSKDIPCLAIFRVNIVEEPSLVEFIALNKETVPRDLADRLKTAEANYKALDKEEAKIKRNIDQSLQIERQLTQAMNNPLIMNPFIFPMNNQQGNDQFFMPFPQANSPQRQLDPAAQAKLEEDRILRQIQAEEFKEVERKIKEQKQKEQNDQVRKRKEEEDKIERLKQAEIEKEFKRNNIPAEPAENEPNVILLIFRVPDGSRIQRRFYNNTKVQLLYDFIDTQDIKFDNHPVYDLIQPNPFVSVTDKEKTINDYFEGSDHEVLHIREQI
jgi:hypothetical protein